MSANVKIRTEDVVEILDGKILATSNHSQLSVTAGEDYDSVLTKIAQRTPTLNQKEALNAATSPSVVNPYITLTELNQEIDQGIPWKTIGLVGSNSDYEGTDETVFQTAFGSGDTWFIVREGVFTFTSKLTVPAGFRVMGSSSEGTILQGNFADAIIELQDDTFFGHIQVVQQAASQPAVHIDGDNLSIEYIVAQATITGNAIQCSTNTNIHIFNSAVLTGKLSFTTVTDSFLHGVYADCPTINAFLLTTCDNISVTGCIIRNGVFATSSSTNIRVVGNHLNDGTSIVGSTNVLLRANTPNTFNNEEDDFQDLLTYIGSPSVSTEDPPFSNNYGGPPGEDLTARVSALDLLVQWRYEERNFHLRATTEPTTVTWNPATNQLSTTGSMRLVSSHRTGNWILPQLGSTTPVTFTSQLAQDGSTQWLGGVNRVGQVVTSALQGNLGTVALTLSNPTVTTGTIVVDLYAVSGGVPTGASIATSNGVSVASIPGTATVTNFTFPTTPLLSNATEYAFVLRETVAMSGLNGILVHRQSGNPYASGQQVNSINSGSTWTQTLTHDLYFNVTGNSISTITLNSGQALYYIIDRTLNVADITLAPFIAPITTLPNNRDNRQIWVLAFCQGSTLWWRGGGGSRFPGTGSQIGTYFVDGSSKSFLDYVGATDYNDFDPDYSHNFTGTNGESLTVRLGKTDTLIKRLYEYSNLGVHLSDAGFISVEQGPTTTYTVTLSGTVYLSFPHVAGRITATSLAQNLNDGDVWYFLFSQGTLAGIDQAITSNAVVANGSLPLPSPYSLNDKYFVFARRVGTSVYLWDDTELPLGGRFPIPIGRNVIPRAAPATLAQNVVWDGTNLLWEGMAVAGATGISVDRNRFPDQTTASPGLTNLAEGEGIVVTHTWNTGTTPNNVTLQKLSLPTTNVLNQNQFIWAQRRNNYIILV